MAGPSSDGRLVHTEAMGAVDLDTIEPLRGEPVPVSVHEDEIRIVVGPAAVTTSIRVSANWAFARRQDEDVIHVAYREDMDYVSARVTVLSIHMMTGLADASQSPVMTVSSAERVLLKLAGVC